MSISQAKRLIKDRAVEVNGRVCVDSKYITKKGDKIKVGKRTFLLCV
jgi:ribosomal protein S4